MGYVGTCGCHGGRRASEESVRHSGREETFLQTSCHVSDRCRSSSVQVVTSCIRRDNNNVCVRTCGPGAREYLYNGTWWTGTGCGVWSEQRSCKRPCGTWNYRSSGVMRYL